MITDTDRLDWMEEHLAHLCIRIPKPNSPKKRGWAANPSINYEYTLHTSLRDAVDEKIEEDKS